MKKSKLLTALALCFPLLCGCATGAAVGATAKVAGTAVSVGAKVTKVGAGVATGAVGKVSRTVFGDNRKPKKDE